MRNLLIGILSFLLLFVLPGCQPVPRGTPVAVTSPAGIPVSLPTAFKVLQASPTPLLPDSSPPIQTPALLAATPTPYPDPLRFTFPTANFDPVTIWRPPLYDVPWEPTPYDHFYFSRPIGADEINWPLPIYRYGGVFFENVVHTGIDIPSPKGTPVLAAGDGEVVWAGYGLFYLKEDPNDPYGKAIVMRHDFGFQGNVLYTVYGHMDDYYFVRGQKVKKGTMIGIVGETGQVTGPHLHFEVRVGDNNYSVSRNPELWIAPPQGWGILTARVLDSDGDLLPQQTVNIRSLATNQYWFVITYGGKSVNSDPYYRENMVIGDLPAGKYAVWIEYEKTVYEHIVEIKPGQVTYFRFIGRKGFFIEAPPTPQSNFTPPETTATPTSVR